MSNESQLLMLPAGAVAAFLEPDDVLTAVSEAFILHSETKGRVFPVVREKLKPGGIFGIKSGMVESEGLLGFKAAGFWPANRARGHEPHQATIMLIDPATGRPVCIIDGNAITTARTGAAGATGLKLLAPVGEVPRICIFGTGVQAAGQLDYALRVLGADMQCVVRYVSSDRRSRPLFEKKFENRAQLICSDDADDAVAQSNIVVTATPGKGPLFNAAALQPGTHLNCVGADTVGKRELPEGVLARATLLVVDDRVQARQIGETQWQPETPVLEIGDLLSGAKSFKRQPGDITVFDMTGLALQDLTVGRTIYEQARLSGAGLKVDWPW